MAFIEIENVTHTYGGQAGASATLAVEGLSIRVNEGEFAAVVGPSVSSDDQPARSNVHFRVSVENDALVSGSCSVD